MSGKLIPDKLFEAAIWEANKPLSIETRTYFLGRFELTTFATCHDSIPPKGLSKEDWGAPIVGNPARLIGEIRHGVSQFAKPFDFNVIAYQLKPTPKIHTLKTGADGLRWNSSDGIKWHSNIFDDDRTFTLDQILEGVRKHDERTAPKAKVSTVSTHVHPNTIETNASRACVRA